MLHPLNVIYHYGAKHTNKPKTDPMLNLIALFTGL